MRKKALLQNCFDVVIRVYNKVLYNVSHMLQRLISTWINFKIEQNKLRESFLFV
jgi:hypothetical protein